MHASFNKRHKMSPRTSTQTSLFLVLRNTANSLLAQSHNTPLLPPPKKKILHNNCLQVLLGHEDVLREIKNNAYANFGGLKRCIMGFVQVLLS